jgi:hypothetical protein
MPDIGAYEAGETHYWIPGHRQARASTLVPPNGVRNVKKDAALMFLEAHGAQRHVVTFQDAARDHRDKLELNDVNIADPGPLRPGETYFWRVDAAMPDYTIIEGTRWTFTVEKFQVKVDAVVGLLRAIVAKPCVAPTTRTGTQSPGAMTARSGPSWWTTPKTTGSATSATSRRAPTGTSG